MDRIVENADVLVGNEEDLQKGLGIPGPEVAAKSKLDPSAFFGMIDKVVAKLPQVKVVATTLREVHSTDHHSWSAVAWVEGQTCTAPTCDLHVRRPGRRRRWIRERFLLRTAQRRIAGSRIEARLGPRGTPHDISRRHDDVDPRTGAGVRERRLGAHSAIVRYSQEDTCLLGDRHFRAPSNREASAEGAGRGAGSVGDSMALRL